MKYIGGIITHSILINIDKLRIMIHRPCRFFLRNFLTQRNPQVPGCGSGPFGTAAVDYQQGIRRTSDVKDDRLSRSAIKSVVESLPKMAQKLGFSSTYSWFCWRFWPPKSAVWQVEKPVRASNRPTMGGRVWIGAGLVWNPTCIKKLGGHQRGSGLEGGHTVHISIIFHIIFQWLTQNFHFAFFFSIPMVSTLSFQNSSFQNGSINLSVVLHSRFDLHAMRVA